MSDDFDRKLTFRSTLRFQSDSGRTQRLLNVNCSAAEYTQQQNLQLDEYSARRRYQNAIRGQALCPNVGEKAMQFKHCLYGLIQWQSRAVGVLLHSSYLYSYAECA